MSVPMVARNDWTCCNAKPVQFFTEHAASGENQGYWVSLSRLGQKCRGYADYIYTKWEAVDVPGTRTDELKHLCINRIADRIYQSLFKFWQIALKWALLLRSFPNNLSKCAHIKQWSHLQTKPSFLPLTVAFHMFVSVKNSKACCWNQGIRTERRDFVLREDFFTPLYL